MPTEFEILMLHMDDGFKTVYQKVDKLKEDFTEHKIPCVNKFAEIDKKLAVKEAVNCEKEEQEERKRDWGMWFVRGTLGAISFGALVLLWKLIIGSVKIIGG